MHHSEVIHPRRVVVCLFFFTIAFLSTACSERDIAARLHGTPEFTPASIAAALATDIPTPLSVTPTAAASEPAGSEPTATATGTPLPTDTPIPTITAAPTLPPNSTRIPTRLPPAVTLNACTTIWEPGYYKLASNIKTIEFDCFYVQSNNVVFDCDNHTIEGNNYTGYAVFVRKWGFPFPQTPTNIEIKNCKVLHHRAGIFVGGGNNIYVHHNDLSDNLDTIDKARFGVFLGLPEPKSGGLTEGGGLRFDTVKGGRAEYNTTNREAIGIDVRDSDNVTVRYNTASNNSAWGINLLNTSHSQVSNNTTRDNVRYCEWGNGTVGRGCDAGGIMLQDGSSHNVISENVVAGENGNGIFIKAHGSRCGNDNLISNNKISDAIYNSVEFSFCDGNRVIGNEISGSYDAVWFGFSTNTEVRKNTISNMLNHGVISFNSRNSLISENTIVNSREGIYFYWQKWDTKAFYFLPPSPDEYASRNNTIRDNALGQNAVAGIHLQDSVQNQIFGNTFNNNAKNVWTQGKGDGNQISSTR